MALFSQIEKLRFDFSWTIDWEILEWKQVLTA